VRPAFFEAEREEARRRLGLDPALSTLLIMGGSTGASTINRAIAAWVPDFLRDSQLFHISGRNDEAWLRDQRDQLPAELRERYHLHDYVHEDIAQVFAAADLAIMRAGASTLGELPATRLPSILIPGDFSDQTLNARYLEQEGAAIMLPQSRLDELQGLVVDFLADEARLQGMREALARLSRPDAADKLASLIAEMAGVRQEVAV
jgi:UDP-N-acetylglucosamine--N-acetylmuramyl-(pentapeptide) pyrophosphoryl-undecaprenol N-acetylglucosamine transferase